jgi:hypothetical protein
MNREDRWYVRFQGHTLGPLTTEQIKTSVKKKELGPDDSLAPVRDPSWRPLRAVPDFFHFWEGLSRPKPVELAPLPPPSILWKKKAEKPLASLPKAPPPKEAKLEAQPEASPAPSAPAVEIKKQKAPALKAKAKAKSKPKRAKPKKKAPAPAKAKEKIAAQEPIPEAVIPAVKVSVAEEVKAPAPVSAPVAVSSLARNEALGPEAAPAAASLAKSATLLNKEAALLLASLRDWSDSEETKPSSPADPAAPTASAAPAEKERTESPKVFFDRPEIPLAPPAAEEPANRSAEKKSPAKAAGRIELQLNLHISKPFLALALAVVALAAAALVVIETKKMRGPEDFRLPDPSGPTAEPSSGDDPIPQLRAPTRPRRD